MLSSCLGLAPRPATWAISRHSRTPCYEESGSCARSPTSTCADGRGFMALAGKLTIRNPHPRLPLTQANEAMAMLRRGDIEGAVVLRP